MLLIPEDGAEMIQQVVHGRVVFWWLRDDHKIVQVDIRECKWSRGRLGIIGVYGVRCGGMYDGMFWLLNKGVVIGVVAEGCFHVG
jgi:hypothetical protein